MMLTQILGGIAPGREVAEIAEAEVSRQAMMIAYVDDYWAMMWTVLIALPLILLLRPIRAPRAGGPSTAGHAE
jgi:DHA2 family multidrug resistance protein